MISKFGIKCTEWIDNAKDFIKKTGELAYIRQEIRDIDKFYGIVTKVRYDI